MFVRYYTETDASVDQSMVGMYLVVVVFQDDENLQ